MAAAMNENLPISEQYRITAKKWIDADAAASLLEETKSAFLAKRMTALGDMPVSRAEMTIKASPEWSDYISKMVRAREQASLLKVQLEYIRMKFGEWNSETATKRAEMRL
jgi:hypothetical protein